MRKRIYAFGFTRSLPKKEDFSNVGRAMGSAAFVPVPVCSSMASLNCPMTSGTDWMRFTSACARSNSRRRFLVSSCKLRNGRGGRRWGPGMEGTAGWTRIAGGKECSVGSVRGSGRGCDEEEARGSEVRNGAGLTRPEMHRHCAGNPKAQAGTGLP